MRLLSNYNSLKDFWLENPQLMIHPTIREFYSSDNSKKKIDSSRLMYGISFLCDLSEDNKYSNYTMSDRKYLIAEEIFGNKEFDWEDDRIKELIEVIDDLCSTPLQRSLKNWKNKLEERDAFLAETPYTLENAEKLDKILAQTDKLFSQYERIVKNLSKEEKQPEGRGKQELSLSDRDEI